MADWFYSRTGQQLGPVSTEQLKGLVSSGEISPDDLLWRDGMAEWVPAYRVKGLFPDAPAGLVPTAPDDRAMTNTSDIVPDLAADIPSDIAPGDYAAMDNSTGPVPFASPYASPYTNRYAPAPFSSGAMVGLVLSTLLIPLIGIITGALALGKPARKSQGTFLLIFGIAITVFYVIFNIAAARM